MRRTPHSSQWPTSWQRLRQCAHMPKCCLFRRLLGEKGLPGATSQCFAATEQAMKQTCIRGLLCHGLTIKGFAMASSPWHCFQALVTVKCSMHIYQDLLKKLLSQALTHRSSTCICLFIRLQHCKIRYLLGAPPMLLSLSGIADSCLMQAHRRALLAAGCLTGGEASR